MSQSFDFKTYDDPHRMFLQAMMCRGIINTSEFRNLFNTVLRRCNVEESDSVEDKKSFLLALNGKIENKCGLKILKAQDENDTKKTKSYLVLVNLMDRSADTNKLTIKSMITFTPVEMDYLKLLMDGILRHPMRELTSLDALNLSNSNKRVGGVVEAERMLAKFQKHRWLDKIELSQGRVYFRLSTRFIQEMQHYLKHVYPNQVDNCDRCKKIVVRSILCSKPDCDAHYHMYCAFGGKCNKCSTDLPRDRLLVENEEPESEEEQQQESEEPDEPDEPEPSTSTSSRRRSSARSTQSSTQRSTQKSTPKKRRRIRNASTSDED